MAGTRPSGSRIHYRMSFRDAVGDKFPGPVIQAPDDAVEVTNVEVWIVPECEPFYKRDEEDPGGA